MNIIYETTKERGATILIPTAMVDSMNPGGLLALANLGDSTQDARSSARDAAAKANAPPKPKPKPAGRRGR